MHQPDRHEDHLALGHGLVAHRLGLGGVAGHHGHGGIEPQGLAEHVAGEGQLLHVRELRGAVAEHLRRLVVHPVLQMRAAGQQVERPGHAGGRGLVPGQEDHADLVEQLLLGEALAVLVPGHDQAGQDVPAGDRPARGDGRQPALQRGGEDAADGPRRAPGAEGRGQEAGRYPRQLQHALGVGDLLEALEGVEEAASARRIHRLGVDGAEDHVGGVVGQLDVDDDGAAGIGLGLRLQPGERGLDRLQHHREDVADAGLLEGGLHQLALSPPGFAVGDEDAVAGQAFQHVAHQGALGEVGGPADQHLPHGLGIADDEERPRLQEREGRDVDAPHRVGLVAALLEHVQGRAQADAQVIPHRRLARQQRRPRRDEGLAHASVTPVCAGARRVIGSGPEVRAKKSYSPAF